MRSSMLLLLALLVGCPSTSDDDDTTSNDDDTTSDDDDTTSDDDDSGDDDDSTADDDDSGDDDDSTADDDDSGDDDDSTADDDDSGDDDDSAPGLCADRDGGAVITLQAGGQTFTWWSTDSAFIDDCIANLGINGMYVILSNPVTPGDCDAQWSFTVEPGFGSLGNSPPFNPACLGQPSDVESNIAGYQAASAGWCPQAGIIAVSDQR